MKHKFLLGTLALATTIVPITTAISCTWFSTKLKFYNYEDYIADESKSGIGQEYSYNTFGDLPELETHIINQNAIGGIGSDYFNANLAKNNLIMKLDLSKIFDLPTDKTKWAAKLQEIYTPEVWTILNQFNNEIGDQDGDGKPDKLWEYSIPYFNQNKVIAFNKNSITKNSPLGSIDLDDQTKIQEWFKQTTDLSYEQILQKLFEAGATKLSVNDYLRDNMIIGSEVLSKEKNPSNNDFKTNGNPPSEVAGKNQIDAFFKMINNIHWTKRKYLTSGTDVLEAILIQKGETTPDADVALLYNGDAMAAAKGGYNYSEADQIRVVVPKNSSFLTDGIIMAKFVEEDVAEQEAFYKAVKAYITQGAQLDPDTPAMTKSSAWWNYDAIRYTPAYQSIYEQMEKHDPEFQGSEAKNNRFIAQATRIAATGNQAGGLTIDLSGRLAHPISNDLTTKFNYYYTTKDKDSN